MRPAAAVGTQFVDPEAPDLSEQRFAASLDAPAERAEEPLPDEPEPINRHAKDAAVAAASPSPGEEIVSRKPDDSEWRSEISARLHRYRARRKIRPPRYPSLNLTFDPVGPTSDPGSPAASSLSAFTPVSADALALDGAGHELAAAAEPEPALEQAAEAVAADTAPAGHSGAKILEFPRFAWAPPPPPLDQLAEPVADRPRILEVPEVQPPPPALGGITIETPERKETEKRPGIDLPLPSASLARRALAAAIDGVMIAAATGLFGVIFWKVAAVRPPLAQIVGLGAGVSFVFWAAYQYLLIVHAASTPGLRITGLELARFDGTLPGRSLRRWRVLASYLSAASLGMGYAWVFLDENALCWHDRITRTFVAPRRRATADTKPTA